MKPHAKKWMSLVFSVLLLMQVIPTSALAAEDAEEGILTRTEESLLPESPGEPDKASESVLPQNTAETEPLDEETKSVLLQSLSVESHAEITASVSLMNAESARLYAAGDSSSANNLLSGVEKTNGMYSRSLDAGEYTLALFDADGRSLGTIVLAVSESTAEFKVYTVTVVCGNALWAVGTDYTVEPSARSGGSEATVVRAVTLGDSGLTFPCLEGDAVAARLIPTAARKAEGYAPAEGGNVVTGTDYASCTAQCGQATMLSVKYPYADSDGNGENDYLCEAGQLSSYFVFSYLTADSVSEPENGMVTAIYSGLSAGNYYYRVTNPLNSSSVTYGAYVTCSLGSTTVTVTSEDMSESDTSRNKTTIDRSFANANDVADIYLGIDGDFTNERYDGAAGQLRMSSGTDATLYAYRNWLAISSTTNDKVLQPDFHVKVIPLEGTSPVTVTENLENTGKKHSFNIHAAAPGTAAVLVTYDAMTFANGMSGSSFSAIWPENTGILLVTVDKDTAIASHMTINGTLNTTTANKQAVERYDAELDMLYYTGYDGASYSFRPEEGVTVTRAFLSGTDLSAFSAEDVSTATDGTVTLTGLRQGKTVVKLTKGDKVTYQVLRAVHTDITVKDAAGNTVMNTALGDTAMRGAYAPGDKLTVSFSTVYHPANKFSGIYNMSAAVCLVGSDGTIVKGTSNQYTFASAAAAHSVVFTVPQGAGKDYTIGGCLNVSGWGSYFGYHRLVQSEVGKSPNFVAVQQNGYMGSLPSISVPMADTVAVSVSVTDENNAPLTDAVLTLKDVNGGTVTPEGGTYTLYGGKAYDYVAFKDGVGRTIGQYTVPVAGGTASLSIAISKPIGSAWDGKTLTEPKKTGEIYEIATGAELAWFASKVNDGTAASADVRLTADIDLSCLDWTPIGSSAKPYAGTFDGSGHTVKGLYITGTTYVGLFGKFAATGIVRNTGVSGFVTGTQYTAGIVGYLVAGARVEGCVSRVHVTGTKNVGGIVGGLDKSTAAAVQIVSCYNAGSVTGTGSQVGGIVGGGSNQVIKFTVDSCYNLGTVNSPGTYCGAVCGGSTNAQVTNCLYLSGSYTGSGSNCNKCGTEKTVAELKAAASALGSAFVTDRYNANSGYPILAWEGKEPDYILGDVNGDMSVSSADAALVYAYHNGKMTLTAAQLLAADVNGDAQVNSVDAAMIYAYHNGRITQFK